MSLSIFAIKNKYYKNGIWWFTKMLNRAVGEDSYNSLRITRRVLSNKFYYLRQHMLYRVFVQSPDVACMIGIYPKTDTTHGYGSNTHYEMYRDFQENTINSDGSFGMWVAYVAAIYTMHAIYSYFLPWYWNKTATCKNGQEQRHRMRDALNSCFFEDNFGIQVLEWGFNPHSYYHIRSKLIEGHAHPDDVRQMHVSSFSRPNRYREHYGKVASYRMLKSF